jgi:hypothetical protein
LYGSILRKDQVYRPEAQTMPTTARQLARQDDAVVIDAVAGSTVLVQFSGNYAGLRCAFEVSLPGVDDPVWGLVIGTVLGCVRHCPLSSGTPELPPDTRAVYRIDSLPAGVRFRTRLLDDLVSGEALVAVYG